MRGLTFSRRAAGLGLLAALILTGDAAGQPDVAPPPRPRFDPGPLPVGAVARIGRPRLNLPGAAIHVAFAPTGTLFVSAGNPAAAGQGADRVLILWDAATGSEVRRFRGHAGGVEALAYSSDGARIVTGGRDKTVRLWDVNTGAEVRQFQGHTAQVLAVAYSPDRKRIASAGHDSAVRVWNEETAQELQKFPAHNSQGTSNVQFSLDGRMLAVVDADFSIRLYDPDTGAQVAKLTGPTRDTLSIDFSRDGKRLASIGEDSKLWVWDVATEKELLRVAAHTALGSCVRFSPDGSILATGGSDGLIHFWDSAGKRLRSAAGHPRNNVSELSFSADGTMLASAGHDGTVRLWDVATGQELPQSGGAIAHAALSPDGKRLATAAGDRLVRFWEPTTGAEILPPLRTDRAVGALAFTPAGELMTSDSTDGFWVWNLDTGKGRQVGAHGSTAVARFAGGGRFVAASGSGPSFRLWDLDMAKGQPSATAISLTANQFSPVRAMALARTGGRLALGCGDGRIRAWELPVGRELYTVNINAPRSEPNALAWAPDGRTFASVGAADQLLRVIEAASGRERVLRPLSATSWAVAFSADGRLIAAGGSGSFRLCDARTGKELVSRATGQPVIGFVAFTPDGRHLVTAGTDIRIPAQKGPDVLIPGQGTALVWDVRALVKDPPPVAKPTAEEVETLWKALAGSDPVAAGDAVWRLAAAPDLALPLLKERLPKVAPGDANERVAKLIAELDDDEFETREKATQELIRLGGAATRAVRDALATSKSREVRRRAEEIIAKSVTNSVAWIEEVWVARGVEVVQRIDTAESRRLLETWAAGTGTLLAREARSALGPQKPAP